MGGVKRFSADNDGVTKWTMGRADQFEFLATNVLMAFIDPEVRITQVKCCCSFGGSVRQPV